MEILLQDHRTKAKSLHVILYYAWIYLKCIMYWWCMLMTNSMIQLCWLCWLIYVNDDTWDVCVSYEIIGLICVSYEISRLLWCKVLPNRKLTVFCPNGISSRSLTGYFLYSPFSCLTFQAKVIREVDRRGARTHDRHMGTLFQMLSLNVFTVYRFW